MLTNTTTFLGDKPINRMGFGAMQLAGHRITVYRKQRDGRWLLARDAHTMSPVEK